MLHITRMNPLKIVPYSVLCLWQLNSKRENFNSLLAGLLLRCACLVVFNLLLLSFLHKEVELHHHVRLPCGEQTDLLGNFQRIFGFCILQEQLFIFVNVVLPFFSLFHLDCTTLVL